MDWSTALVLGMIAMGNLAIMGSIVWIFWKFLQKYADLKMEMVRLIGLNSDANANETVLKMDTGIPTSPIELDSHDENKEILDAFDEVNLTGHMTAEQERILGRG